MTTETEPAVVHGEVASGFEPVRAVLEQWTADLGDGGCAYAAYHRGRKVVDLWAGTAGDRPWGADTTAQFMSVTKALTTLCLQQLSDRGALDVFAPISSYWPEFGAAGKQDITAADVLTHTSGVIGN